MPRPRVLVTASASLAAAGLLVTGCGQDPGRDPGDPVPTWDASVPTRSVAPPGEVADGPSSTPTPEVLTTETTVERTPSAVRVQLWGSSSCPQVVTGSRADGPGRLLVWAEHDHGSRDACTADLARTSSSVPLPDDLRDVEELEVVVVHLDEDEQGVVGSVHRLR